MLKYEFFIEKQGILNNKKLSYGKKTMFKG
jgi:hypothetical protein